MNAEPRHRPEAAFWYRHYEGLEKTLALGIVVAVILTVAFWGWAFLFPIATEESQLTTLRGPLAQWDETQSRARATFSLVLEGAPGPVAVREAALENAGQSAGTFRALLRALPPEVPVLARVGPGAEREVHDLVIDGRPVFTWAQQRESLAILGAVHAAIRWAAPALALVCGLLAWKLVSWKRRQDGLTKPD